MPIREDDDGKLTEAFYPVTPIREGKLGGRDRPAVVHSLGGWEGPEELQEFIDAMVNLMTKHFCSKGIGQEQVQWVLDWMGTLYTRLGLDTYPLVCNAALSRGVVMRPRPQTSRRLVRQARTVSTARSGTAESTATMMTTATW